jgi:serine/threonine-protein kinase
VLQQLSSALEGRYEVEREIGAGGMATVYLARDVRHKRRVALKVLKPELGAVLGVERFLAEIQVTANLQHPNLLPLFDSGEANGLLFYVMPYVDGESLRQRLDREKQLPIDEAVRISVAVAAALEYAHQHGVIHRDLKPENILLQSGQPVIADFGIALAVSNAGGARITQTGLSLGTPQYMSPEQATGDRALDSRTDVYSLGAITYEMLVGDPPHLGGTAQAVIAKVLTERPHSVRVARPSVSEEVAWAVEHALEKLPADRWSSARQFADAIQGRAGVVPTRPAGIAATAPRRVDARTRIALAATSALAFLGVAAAVYFATRPPANEMTTQFDVLLPDSVSIASGIGKKLAMSPDGTRLVIVGVRGTAPRALYLRTLDDPVAHLIPGSDSANSPTFSSDGRWIVFKTITALKRIPVSGGVAQLLADSVFGMGSLGDGGRLLFDRAVTLWVGAAQGRDFKRIAGPDISKGIYRYFWPEMLPGSTHALVTIDRHRLSQSLDSLYLGVVSLSDGSVTNLGIQGLGPHYVAPGRIVFGRGGSVFSVPFSLGSRRITGPPELLLQNVSQNVGGGTEFVIARDAAVLAFLRGSADNRRLVVVGPSGEERVLPGEAATFSLPRVSPDGKHIAVQTGDTKAGVVWIVDPITGARTRLVTDSTALAPQWTRDGKRVVFLRSFPGVTYSRPWDLSGPPEILAKKPAYEVSVGPSGGYWAFRIGFSNRGIVIAGADSLDARRSAGATAVNPVMPNVSPNGHLVAYVSDESGRNEVYVQPIPGPGPRVRVSVYGGVEPTWSTDGRTLYYRAPTHMMAASVSEQPRFVVVKQDSLFADRYERSGHANYDPLPDGRGFLMVRSRPTSAADIGVIVNWARMAGRARE